MNFKVAIVALASSLILVACSSHKDANKANFADAINTALANSGCIAVTPGDALGSDTEYPISIPITDRKEREFDALAKVGLLTSVERKPIRPEILGKRVIPERVYTLTNVGKMALMSPRRKSFCIGDYHVDKVINFTAPGNAMGVIVSHATFTYSPLNVPAWARSEALMAAFPTLAQRLSAGQDGRADMILTNDGWIAKVQGH